MFMIFSDVEPSSLQQYIQVNQRFVARAWRWDTEVGDKHGY